LIEEAFGLINPELNDVENGFKLEAIKCLKPESK
jgi:hypothetical protein